MLFRSPHTIVLQFPTPATDHQAPARPASGRSDHAIALDFVRHVRGVAATTAESDLLRDAFDACCDDPDQDVLVGAPAGEAR